MKKMLGFKNKKKTKISKYEYIGPNFDQVHLIC